MPSFWVASSWDFSASPCTQPPTLSAKPLGDNLLDALFHEKSQKTMITSYSTVTGSEVFWRKTRVVYLGFIPKWGIWQWWKGIQTSFFQVSCCFFFFKSYHWVYFPETLWKRVVVMAWKATERACFLCSVPAQCDFGCGVDDLISEHRRTTEVLVGVLTFWVFTLTLPL